MNPELKKIFEKASKPPQAEEVFAKETSDEVDAQDIFSGDEEFFETLENAGQPSIVTQITEATNVAVKSVTKFFSTTHIILIVNLLAITVILAYLLLRSPVASQVPQAQSAAPDKAQTQEVVTKAVSVETPESLKVTGRTAEALDKAVSWEVAEQLWNRRQYAEAYYVFNQLSDNLITNIPSEKFLKDFLELKMALCIQKTDDQAGLSRLFTSSLQSRSPVVRALANYNLVFAENRNRQYMNARKRAYQTMALLKTFQDDFSPNFEADCYFMLAEALTRQVLLLSSGNSQVPGSENTDELPGEMWSDTLRIESVPEMSQDDLRGFLQAGVYQLSEGAVTPQISKNENLNVGSQFSAVSVEAPLEEILAKYGSRAGMNIIWQDSSLTVRKKPITLCLPAEGRQVIPEIAAGSAGLIARFNGDEVFIYNPDSYIDLDEHKAMLTKEAISVWRRFLQKYRGDHRSANAHFALGLLHEHAGEIVNAMGQYKLTATAYSENPLAPFALLNSSKLKTQMHDYTGARQGLDELLIHYPDCKVVDEASLYLAEATMSDKLYDQAIKRFKKVFNLDLNSQSQRNAAFGLGRCYFEINEHEEARKWLVLAIKQSTDSADHRLQSAYFMLGKVNIELKDYKQASQALRNALGNSAHKAEYIKITLELVASEISQERFLVALNLLESIPASKLSQENACEVLIAKARIFRAISITDSAISLLRRKIEFIADSFLRAKLSFELAKCYVDSGDLRIARKEIADCLSEFPAGILATEANLLLARICIELNDHTQAKNICLKIVATAADEEMKRQALNLLGKAYTNLKQYSKAAQAHAGIYDRIGVMP